MVHDHPEKSRRISFQASAALRLLHDEAKMRGHDLAKLYAAGVLLMLEDSEALAHAVKRLRRWEADFADAGRRELREFMDAVERQH